MKIRAKEGEEKKEKDENSKFEKFLNVKHVHI